ncbi:MAG TPA: NCS1 family nucleobase:cation symporter-1 [Geminicoccaceae bacterium]|nr:NCS1 family nucleobase:cation symporter-1 [Geminicoccaceae bacterium]
MAGGAQTGEVYTPAYYSEKLYNHDLAPLKERFWGWYQVFCMWMADVHSVGGYLFAASLFALGLAAWQVFTCLIVGIVIVMYLTNWVARPGVDLGVPYPVVCRLSFGVYGANIAAVIRGLIAIAWYGIQTYVASKALIVVVLKFFPQYAVYEHMHFLGLSYLGWFAFLVMWVAQFLVFYRGMKAITVFIDWAGPGVYVVMFLLMFWMIYQAGWGNISFTLAEVKYTGLSAFWQMVVATSLVISYFSGPMVNFSDFSRFSKDMHAVKKGNFWGLPVNFIAFSVVTVITTSATLPVFGEYIHDPVEVVARVDSTVAAVLGALTFIIATIGINIVANFVSPAFDFSNVSPKHITFLRGGMIAAVGSVFVMPWHLFNAPEVIHYTLDTLGAAIGPLYGILVVDYFIVKHDKLHVDDLYSDKPDGHYWYSNGFNPSAVKALIIGFVTALIFVVVPQLFFLASFSWGIGALVGGYAYVHLMRRQSVAAGWTEGGRVKLQPTLPQPTPLSTT